MRLSGQDLELMRRFARTPEGRVWLEILGRTLADTDVKLRTTIGDDLLRTQGRAQLLAELIESLTKAEERLERVAPRKLIAGLYGATGNP